MAVPLAEPSAENQWLTPHVGDVGTANRCCLSLSPLTQAGETAHFRQDALPKLWCNPGKKSLSKIQSQDLVSANSEGQRPVAKTLSLQKVCWIHTYLTSADTPHSLAIEGFKCTLCSEQQLDKKHKTLSKHQIQFLLSRQKAEKVFVCLIFGTPNNYSKGKKKADSGLIHYMNNI